MYLLSVYAEATVASMRHACRTLLTAAFAQTSNGQLSICSTVALFQLKNFEQSILHSVSGASTSLCRFPALHKD